MTYVLYVYVYYMYMYYYYMYYMYIRILYVPSCCWCSVIRNIYYLKDDEAIVLSELKRAINHERRALHTYLY